MEPVSTPYRHSDYTHPDLERHQRGQSLARDQGHLWRHTGVELGEGGRVVKLLARGPKATEEGRIHVPVSDYLKLDLLHQSGLTVVLLVYSEPLAGPVVEEVPWSKFREHAQLYSGKGGGQHYYQLYLELKGNGPCS